MEDQSTQKPVVGSVMVVRGRIAGIRAALDLDDAQIFAMIESL